jgi:hypothetical protein
MGLLPSLDVDMVGKVGLVDARLGIGGEGVGDQVPERCVHNDDGGVGTQEEADVVAVGTEGGLGADDDSEDNGRLGMEHHKSASIV